MKPWDRENAAWRDPAQICSQWSDAAALDPELLQSKASRGWWSLLEQLGITLLVTREYENFVMALSAQGGRPRVSYLPMPHPSGMAYDAEHRTLWLASTRNPNQVYRLRPAAALSDEAPAAAQRIARARPLVPVSSAFYPGRLYLHDLAFIGSELHGNAVGMNSVVQFGEAGAATPVWWPRSVERRGKPDHQRNHLQLNSIAAGATLEASYFTASSAAPGPHRPGDLKYPVNKAGVLFSGESREPVCSGLTRPHSARLLRDRVWLANSGYGELGFVNAGKFEIAARLPGWTRGLHLVGQTAFVGTSRVIPRYAAYAPGLRAAQCLCGVFAVDTATGKVLANIEWPAGNQIFAIESMPVTVSRGFCFDAKGRRLEAERAFFYSGLTN